MAEPKNSGGVKTLGVKLTNSLHNQFSLVAQLDDLSLADAVIKAVELYVETKQAAPDFQKRAAEALAEIEREAAARHGAIQALLGHDDAGEGSSGTRKKA
ncbi:hypothetical protein [Actinomadura macra]|uniref:hypothetical protein n=1 Tax=Actinomadura macra TaxID=46164 RepID=UPI0008376E29|nr:hypothetical protein [Actinomadura macra]